MRTTENRLGSHLIPRRNVMSLFLQWHRKAWPRLWEPRSQARMGARLVITDLPILHHPSEMTLTERNEKIQTTPPQAANQAFAMEIGLGRTEGCFQNFNSPTVYQSIQFRRVNLVPIVNQNAVPPLRCQWLLETAAGSRLPWDGKSHWSGRVVVFLPP